MGRYCPFPACPVNTSGRSIIIDCNPAQADESYRKHLEQTVKAKLHITGIGRFTHVLMADAPRPTAALPACTCRPPDHELGSCGSEIMSLSLI